MSSQIEAGNLLPHYLEKMIPQNLYLALWCGIHIGKMSCELTEKSRAVVRKPPNIDVKKSNVGVPGGVPGGDVMKQVQKIGGCKISVM